MILTIRTDKPEAEVGLFDETNTKLAHKTWQAHRALSATIHVSIQELLDQLNASWDDISGIIYFQGPGSFTGLRIGAAVANALAVGNAIALTNEQGSDWIRDGIENLQTKGQTASPEVAVPEYGAEPFTTQPKK